MTPNPAPLGQTGQMPRYIALLRGVNVGGITIKMADLARVVTDLGHTQVRTVLASGNVIFDSSHGDLARLKAGIETALTEAFDYRAWVVLLTQPQLTAAVAGFPFESREGWHSYVLFGTEAASLGDLLEQAPSLDPAVERVLPGSGVLYWQVSRAVGIKSPFSVLAAKPRYKSSTTNRNLNTLHKILDLADAR